MKTISIVEQDLALGVQEINKLLIEENSNQDHIKNIVLHIFRAGMFKGLNANGAVIIKDETKPTLFSKLKEKLSWLF